MLLDLVKNFLFNRVRYKTHSEACIVACFYNPQNNPYRLLAFQKWYKSIKHLNHKIIECSIGNQTNFQLPDDPNIIKIHSESLLWHKETLLNKVISELPKKYKYIFWLDTDVLFTNNNWLIDAVELLKHQDKNIVQLFDYCVHLEKNQLKPDFNTNTLHFGKITSAGTNKALNGNKRVWRGFASTFINEFHNFNSNEYDAHGHVGFAWGAKREILEQCPLYDRALIGGADHIIAHAAAGQIIHPCIANGFKDNIHEVEEWSRKFYSLVQGKIGYVKGDLYHIWHGDIGKREYLKRIKDFTAEANNITIKDENGLYVAGKYDRYVKKYYKNREDVGYYDFDGLDAGFIEDMGYSILDFINMYSQNQNLDFDSDDSQDSNVNVAVDDGRHVITEEMLKDATIISPSLNEDDLSKAIQILSPSRLNEDDLNAAIHNINSDDMMPTENNDNDNDDGNFS